MYTYTFVHIYIYMKFYLSAKKNGIITFVGKMTRN